MSTRSDDAPRWRGINHLALVTPDMDATVRFYDGVLGMRLVATLRAGPMRHYFFEMAPGNTIAFFEVEGAATFTAPAGLPDRMRKAQFDHLSFNLPDEQALLDLRDRLKSHGCEVTDVVDHDILRSIYFNDPHGIAHEASWWVVDPTGRPSDFGDDRIFSDKLPTPSVHELSDDGVVAWTPQSTLADDKLPPDPA